MFKVILILLIGMAIGYAYGYSDHKKHGTTIIERSISKVGGANRGRYDQDVDKRSRGVQ